MKLPSDKRSSEAVSSIGNVEPPSTEPSTAKFFKILDYTQLTVRQISSGSSQNWSIGTDFTHVPRGIAGKDPPKDLLYGRFHL